MDKNWRDAREKARVITYEGSSYWPFLEVIFKNDFLLSSAHAIMPSYLR
jgi:hypothetical protein